jgi:antigen flippase
LTACAQDNAACNRLVNEQLSVGVLLGAPGVILTLTCAPIVITVFYSPHFYPAVEILRWICLGVALRMITWPMGFIIMAKGKTALVFWTDFAWTVVNVALTGLSVSWYGLNGIGFGFFGSYIFHGILLYPIVRRLSGFSLTSENRMIGAVFMTLIGIAFCGFTFLPPAGSLCLGLAATMIASFYSVRRLLTFMSHDVIPRPVGRVLAALRLQAPVKG